MVKFNKIQYSSVWQILFPSLLLLSLYYSNKLLFSKYLYNHGDLFNKEKFGILKLFRIFIIYHSYYFKGNYLKTYVYLTFPFFSYSFGINKLNNRLKVDGCPLYSQFIHEYNFHLFSGNG